MSSLKLPNGSELEVVKEGDDNYVIIKKLDLPTVGHFCNWIEEVVRKGWEGQDDELEEVIMTAGGIKFHGCVPEVLSLKGEGFVKVSYEYSEGEL